MLVYEMKSCCEVSQHGMFCQGSVSGFRQGRDTAAFWQGRNEGRWSVLLLKRAVHLSQPLNLASRFMKTGQPAKTAATRIEKPTSKENVTIQTLINIKTQQGKLLHLALFPSRSLRIT